MSVLKVYACISIACTYAFGSGTDGIIQHSNPESYNSNVTAVYSNVCEKAQNYITELKEAIKQTEFGQKVIRIIEHITNDANNENINDDMNKWFKDYSGGGCYGGDGTR